MKTAHSTKPEIQKTSFVSPQLDIYTVVLCVAGSGVRLLSVGVDANLQETHVDCNHESWISPSKRKLSRQCLPKSACITNPSMAPRGDQSYPSTYCQKNVTPVSSREDDTWRRGAGGGKKDGMPFFTSACALTHADIHLHKCTGETWSCRRLTNKWQTNDLLEHLHQAR